MNEATMLIVYVATKQIEFLIHSQCSLKAQVSTRRTTNERVIRFRFQLWEVVLDYRYYPHCCFLSLRHCKV